VINESGKNLKDRLIDVIRVCTCTELNNKVNEARFTYKGDRSRLKVISLK